MIVNQYQYSPWGESVLQTERPDAQQPFRFVGAEYDAPLRLYKMGARYYDPAVGRFTQRDPFGGGYMYAGNGPINSSDKTGLQEDESFWEEAAAEWGEIADTVVDAVDAFGATAVEVVKGAAAAVPDVIPLVIPQSILDSASPPPA